MFEQGGDEYVGRLERKAWMSPVYGRVAVVKVGYTLMFVAADAVRPLGEADR